jgi:hypothetical protein
LLKRVKALVLGQRVSAVKVARIRRKSPRQAPAPPESAERAPGGIPRHARSEASVRNSRGEACEFTC